jgi:hypothetical protein
MTINNPKRSRQRLRRKKAENLRRRKETLLKKVYELGRDFDVDVAFILRQNGRFVTYPFAREFSKLRPPLVKTKLLSVKFELGPLPMC